MSMHLQVSVDVEIGKGKTFALDLVEVDTPDHITKIAMMNRKGKILREAKGKDAIRALRVYSLWYQSLPITDLKEHREHLAKLDEYIDAAERGNKSLRAWWG